jgi:serine/threonine protein kinase/formylglycine-generating enzyme required for sulfatase activity
MKSQDGPKTVSWQSTPRHHPSCDEFASAWLDGQRPQIEAYLREAPEQARAALFWELLNRELDLRAADGEHPVLADYEQRFPEHADAIRAFFKAREPSVPERIGRYEVRRRLGGGGFGTVYLCFDDRAQRQVAVKVPRPERLTSADARAAFLREARNVARLDHPHIVPLYDIGDEDGLCYLVYKHIEGQSLFERMAQGPIPLTLVAAIVAQTAEALHHAHGKNLFHRDIKPGNLLLDAGGKVFVTDFGLAIPEEEMLQERGRRSGTYPYMSPEQVRGEGHRVDGRTDIYSLGVVLYELLTERRPFVGNTAEVYEQILHSDARPPRQIRDGVPRELERICLKAMARQMSARYATAHDLAEDLRLAIVELRSSDVAAAPKPSDAGRPVEVRADAVAPLSSRPYSPMVPKGLRSYGPEDRDFFLELLPGPRDRDGLPESLRFWKTRIENPGESTFAVGLLYGPSGCGKSSLIKAGLLPRLASGVVPVYLEASAHLTEAQLAKGLRHACPELPVELGLPQMLAQLRRGRSLGAPRRLLIVLDQFEQWLHAHGHDMEASELVAGLRHADGVHVQFLLLVRDDFWMGTSRLFELLEINLDRERNARAVDLFDAQHARRVLAMIGQAYERLPVRMRDLSPDQVAFLERAVAQLAEDGRVIPVRLSLFADLMKDRLWTSASLVEVGGAEGVGLRFLDETFAARSALPDLRALEKPVRALLRALLPEAGSDIKGRLRSRAELAAESGLPENSPRFARLLEILDRELHIIAPTEAEPAPESSTAGPCYQLTHDFLVPPLRLWLTQEQRKSLRGRAELCLQERTAQWMRTHDERFLLSTLEYLKIAIAVPSSAYTAEQRQLVRAATRRQLVKATLAVGALLAAVVIALLVRDRVRVNHAQSLVDTLLRVETSDVPAVIAELEPLRAIANARLAEILANPGSPAKQRLHASLAMLRVDPEQAAYLKRRMLEAPPQEFLVIRQTMSPVARPLIGELWSIAQSPREEPQRRFRAAGALALFDPRNPHWAEVSAAAADTVASEPALLVHQWIPALRPVKDVLIPSLKRLYEDTSRPEQRHAAAVVLAEFLADDVDSLALLLHTADDAQLVVLTAHLGRFGDAALPRLRQMILEGYPANAREPEKEAVARRQSNGVLALLLLAPRGDAWQYLRHQPDPRARTSVVHRMASVHVALHAIVDRLHAERDPSIRAALIHALGEYPEATRLLGSQSLLLPILQQLYQHDDDAGVHCSAEWLLRRLGSREELELRDGEPGRIPPPGKRRWFIATEGHLMTVIDGPVRFQLGSPASETGRSEAEPLAHSVEVRRRFALGTRPVTWHQFLQFRPAHRGAEQQAQVGECPVTLVNMQDAAEYCNWLSERAGIEKSDWCYIASADEPQLIAAPDYLSRPGYRIPTEEEWECGCRAGAITRRFFGESDEWLPKYGWFLSNSDGRARPVALQLPNDFGVFDVHGNVNEWCERSSQADKLLDRKRVIMRGGAYIDRAIRIRAAARSETLSMRYAYVGFRVARTCPTVADR